MGPCRIGGRSLRYPYQKVKHMGFTSAWKSLVNGDFSDAFNNALISEDDLAVHASVANAQEQIVARQNAAGVIGDTEANLLMSEIARNAYPYNADTVGPGGLPSQVFVDTFKGNAGRLGQAFTSTLNGVIKIFPWWLWVIAGGVFILWAWPFLSQLLARTSRK